jgi:predicted ATPase
MRINNIEADNLFSFDNLTETNSLKLASNNAVIIGPNNSGKSNIFRLIELLITEIESAGSTLSYSHFFDVNRQPSLKLDCTFSEDEVIVLIDFLNYFISNQLHKLPITDQSNVKLYLDEVSFHTNWEQFSYQNAETYPATFYMMFSKLDLTFRRDYTGGWDFIVEGKPYQISDQLFECLNDIKSPVAFREMVRLKCIKQFKPVDLSQSLGLKQVFPNHELPPIRNILRYYQDDIKSPNFHLYNFISRMFKYSIFFVSGTRVITQSEKIGYPYTLKSDGSNITQYLYTLYVSRDRTDREKFRTIQQRFETIFDNRLNFEIVINYELDNENARSSPDKRLAESISIIINDKNNNKQFGMNQVGTGVTEVLFLITMCFGMENTIILIDEPATNLHPSLMKKITTEILGQNLEHNINQIILITHSPKLLQHLFVAHASDIFYVRKNSKGVSIIKTMDSSTKDELLRIRPKIGYSFDFELFFSRVSVLVEGPTDKMVIESASEFFNQDNSEFSFGPKDIVVIQVGGAEGFPKYKMVVEAFGIPHLFIGDNHVLKNKKNISKIFAPVSFIKVNRIEDKNAHALVIEKVGNGNMEDLLMAIDPNAFQRARRYVTNTFGRDDNKPLISYYFMKLVSEKNPRRLDVFKELITRIVEIRF